MKDNKPTTEEIEKVKLRNDEINEIIGVIPHWFVQFGISIIFVFIALILIGCWFFKYPDIVTANVEITANNPPATIVARSTGKIDQIFVKDNQIVEKDDILAIIENTSDFNDVQKLKRIVDTLNLAQKEFSLNTDTIVDINNLGTIQPAFSSFLKHCHDYNNFIKLNYHQKKIQALLQETKQQNRLMDKLIKKLEYSKEQLSLSSKQFARDSVLFKKQVFSQAEFEKSQNAFLLVKSNFETNNSDVLSTRIQISKLEQSILDLESQKMEQSSQQFSTLKESYELVLAQIADWERLYLLKSPVKGKITFTRFWDKNQNIKTGDEIFTVVPEAFKNYIAKIELPIANSGKVKTGQQVIIKLDDFPYMEYGFLKGCISKVSLVPTNGYYTAEIILPSELVTTYKRNISFKNEYNGTAEIITKNERLLMRFIYPIKALFNRNSQTE